MNIYDWRKHASMTAADDTEVEKAFMDQAYGFVANKAGPLMKDPHRLGFEVVSKNDENTRMVGIFAFRVNDQLLYVPVFFINGEIKGTDLLYRHDTKTFVPLNEEWVTWLIEKNEQDTGRGLDRSMRRWTMPDVRLRDLVTPGGHGPSKAASAAVKGMEDILGCTLPELAEKMASQTDPGPVLKDFILSHGKVAAMCSIEQALKNVKFAEAMVQACDIDTFAPSELPEVLAEDEMERKQAAESGVDFNALAVELAGLNANLQLEHWKADTNTNTHKALGDLYDNMINLIDEFAEVSMGFKGTRRMPSQTLTLAATGNPKALLRKIKDVAERIVENAKTAKADDLQNLGADILAAVNRTLYKLQGAKEASSREKLVLYIGAPPAGIKEAAETFYKKGYMLVDSRKPAEDEMSVVYEDTVRDLEQFSGPGLYDVLMSDGTTQKGFAAHESSEEWDRSYSNCSAPATISTGDFKDNIRTVVVMKDGQSRTCPRVYGHSLKSPEQCKEDGDLKKEMASGKTYRVFQMRQGTLSPPIHVQGKRTRKGITTYSCTIRYKDTEFPVTHNPDFRGCALNENILGDDALFIEVKVDIEKHDNNYIRWTEHDNVPVGDRAALENWLWATGTFQKASLRKSASGEYFLKTAGGTSNLVTRMDMLVGLARDCKIAGDTTEALLDAADRLGSIEFWLEPHEKQASRVMSVLGDPNFQESFDGIHGVSVQNPMKAILDTEQQIDPHVDSRIGDAWDPTSADGLPTSLLQSMPPEELQQLAQMHKLPHVFEHGVVGALSQTYDSSAMIAKYLPGFEKALDSLGRVLFLFYWKPGDFEDAYGTDDMTNMENELLSNFKSFGQLVLNLLKKNKRQAEGSPPLPI